jgi:lipase
MSGRPARRRDSRSGEGVVVMAGYEQFEVAAPGGRLAVGRWGSGPRVLWGGHGLTGNHRSFGALARALGPQFTLITPDLRGRAGSAALGGPYGLAAHAADAVAVLDHLGLDRVEFVGHAVGGYVAAEVAVGYPDRVARLLLLDGGLPFAPDLDPGTDLREVAIASVNPGRLDRRFPSAQAYLDSWRAHPSVGPYWNDVFEQTYRYDLTGGPDDLHPSSDKEAVTVDCMDQIGHSAATAAKLTNVPITFLWASHGLADQTPGLYTEAAVEGWCERLPQVRAERAEGLNHMTLLMTDKGARLVAAALAG